MKRLISSATLLALLVASSPPAEAAADASDASEERVERIAFVVDGDVHTVHPDGSDLTRLTTTGDAASPAWSPDGTRIAFNRGLDAWPPERDIWVMTADGSEQQLLIEDGFSPAWSRDGTQIAFARFVADPGEDPDGGIVQLLFIADADGTNQRQLTQPNEDHFHTSHDDPVWSPDGTRIAFADWGFTNPHVYSVASDGSDVRLLNDYGFDPAWSADGSTIAFARFLRLCAGALWVMDADGDNPRELVKDPGDCDIRWPAYSPDGAHIVFETFPLDPDDPRLPAGVEPPPAGLHIVDADGSNRRFLIEGTQPDWQLAPTLEPGAIAGTVTDALTGNPLGAAIVRANGRETMADLDGRYAIADLEPGVYTVTTHVDSYVNASETVTVAAGQTTTVDFALTPHPGAIAGTVTDAFTEQGIPGATVSTAGREAISDADGRYHIDGLEPGVYTVTAEADGYQPATETATVEAGQLTGLDFSLTPLGATGTIAGTVLDALTGERIEGAAVSTAGRAATSDVDGRYHIDGLEPGVYTVTVEADGYEPETRTVTVQAGQLTTLDFRLAPTHGTLRGSVRQNGEPLEHARVFIEHGETGQSVVVRTSSEGTYEASVPSGAVGVRASYAGVASERVVVDVPPGGEADADFDLPPQAGTLLDLQVHTHYAGAEPTGPLELEGMLASMLNLTLETPAGDIVVTDNLMFVTGPAGSVVRLCGGGLGTGGVATGLVPACDEAVLGEAGRVPLEITLVQLAALTGTLIDAAGEPYTGPWEAGVYALGDDGRRSLAHSRSGWDSTIDIGLAELGSYEVVFDGDERTAQTVHATEPATIYPLGEITLGAPAAHGGPGSGMQALRPQVLPGGSAEYRAVYDAVDDTLDATLHVVIPGGTTLREGSVMLDGSLVETPSARDGRFEIALGDTPAGVTRTLRFQVAVPESAPPDTRLRASATIADEGGEHPLGSAVATVVGLTLVAPEATASRDVVLTGRGPAGAAVELYDGHYPVGVTTVGAGGYWRKQVTLVDRGAHATHRLWAQTTDSGLRSGSAFVIVDLSIPQLVKVAVQQENGVRVEFDPRDGTARFPYVLWPTRPFTVEATFTEPDRVTDVEVVIGDARQAASRTGDVWAAVFHLDMTEFGPIEVNFEYVPTPYDFTTPLPDEIQARESVLPAFADFRNVEVHDNRVTFDLPSFGDDARMELEITTDEVDYEPTPEDIELVEASGVPVYGLTIDEEVTAAGFTLTVTGYVPEDALPEAPNAEQILAFFGGSAISPATVAPAAAVRFIEVGISIVGHGEGVVSALTGGRKYDRLEGLYDHVLYCDPSRRDFHFDMIDSGIRSARVSDIASGAMTVGAFALGALGGPPGVVLGVTIGLAFNAMLRHADRRNYERRREWIAEDVAAGRCSPPSPPGNQVADPVYIFDPSGFVYEAVESNRLEGVTATLYQGFPEPPDDPTDWVAWDAEWYGQANPQLTDSAGRYGWDVPEGWWRVAYELEGYEVAHSEVLRVLPIHLDVNVGLVSLSPPEVHEVTATTADESSVLIEFTQYMRTATLTDAQITVQLGAQVVAGTVTPVEPEDAPERDGGHELATSFRFVPDGPFVAGEELSVSVDRSVQSYAGREMLDDSVHTVVVTAAPVDDPTSEIDDLLARIDGYGLPRGIAQALSAPLRVARNLLESDQERPVCELLSAFLNQVDAHEGRRLTAEQADGLRDGADRLHDTLSCRTNT